MNRVKVMPMLATTIFTAPAFAQSSPTAPANADVNSSLIVHSASLTAIGTPFDIRETKAVLGKQLSGFLTNPQTNKARSMRLKTIQP